MCRVPPPCHSERRACNGRAEPNCTAAPSDSDGGISAEKRVKIDLFLFLLLRLTGITKGGTRSRQGAERPPPSGFGFNRRGRRFSLRMTHAGYPCEKNGAYFVAFMSFTGCECISKGCTSARAPMCTLDDTALLLGREERGEKSVDRYAQRRLGREADAYSDGVRPVSFLKRRQK